MHTVCWQSTAYVTALFPLRVSCLCDRHDDDSAFDETDVESRTIVRMLEFFEKLLMGCYVDMQDIFRVQAQSLHSVSMLQVVTELAQTYGGVIQAKQTRGSELAASIHSKELPHLVLKELTHEKNELETCSTWSVMVRVALHQVRVPVWPTAWTLPQDRCDRGAPYHLVQQLRIHPVGHCPRLVRGVGRCWGLGSFGLRQHHMTCGGRIGHSVEFRVSGGSFTMAWVLPG